MMFMPHGLSRVIAWLLVSFALDAQTGTGSLQGVVSDPSGSVIPNASVRVSGAARQERTTLTDAQGQYRLNGLPAGAYVVRAESPGFTAFEKSGVVIAAGQAKPLDISLLLRVQAEQVTVAAEPAAQLDTDPSSNAGALVLRKEDLDALPDDRDDLTADLQELAGPAAGPDGGQFFIDGFTGGRMPPKTSIREIRINQNPFAAQFDRPGQGRVEIFTKPGTDDFHGELLYQFSDARFNSRNPFVAVKPPYQRRQWEAEAGGPINRKTSFLVDYERRDISENQFVNATVLDANLNAIPFSQAFVTPVTGVESNARLDRQVTANHTLTLRYDYGRDGHDISGVGAFSLPERAYKALTTERAVQIVETGILNQHVVNEARFRARWQDSDQSGGADRPVINVMDAFTSGGSSVGNSFDRQGRYEIQNITSVVHGPHTMRFGGVVRLVTLEDQAMQNYSGTFTFTSLIAYRATLLGIQQHLSPAEIRAMGGGASQFGLSAGDPLASLFQSDYGFFAQDDWRLMPNFTLSGGLRYEFQTNSSDHANMAPRLAFAWGVGHKNAGAPRNVIRGGAGVFYDRLSESLTLEALRQNGVTQQQFLIQNPDFYPAIPAPATLTASAQPQTIRETDAHWRAPIMVQEGIGYERQLPKHITAAVNFLHTNGSHALRSRNINAPVPGTAALPYGGANAIYLYETSGAYRQNQLIANVNARVSPKVTFAASYVFGTAVSNTDGSGAFPANQYDLSNEFGPALFNVRHRFQMNGSLAPGWGFRLSPFVTATSGRPYNITTGTDLNGDGLFTDRPGIATDPSLPGVRNTVYGLLDPNPRPGEAVLGRNAGTAPVLVTVNLRLTRTFNLGQHEAHKDSARQLVFAASARNALNHQNLRRPSGNLGSPQFGQSAGLASGGQEASGSRRIDLQARFIF